VTETHRNLNEFDDILRMLTGAQLEFVTYRMHLPTDKAAAEKIGLAPDTVYGWPNKDAVNRAVRLAKLDGVQVGRERLRRLIGKAIDVLEDELDASGIGDNNRLKAALEVLDRTGLEGKAGIDVTSEGKRLGGGDDYRAAILGALRRVAESEEAEKVDSELNQ